MCFLLTLLSGTAFAQQNFFNIPSGQITEEDKVFYQHQLNVFSDNLISSKQHFVLGLDQNTEIGVNFQNYDPIGNIEKEKQVKTGPQSNIIAPSFQKAFSLSSKVSLNIGAQAGITHVGTGDPAYVAFKTFGLVSYYDPEKHLRLTGGTWVSGERFNGPGDSLGALLGFEIMVADKLTIMGDWISGDTQNSTSVIGGMVDVTKTIQLCAGYLIPNPKSPENHGLVLEVNIFN
jgi:hypothetical protein